MTATTTNFKTHPKISPITIAILTITETNNITTVTIRFFSKRLMASTIRR